MGQIKPFIPADFKVPHSLQNEHFRIRMLTVNDVVKDYDAVMSSVEHLETTKPFGTNHNWPRVLTLEQNLIDLGWHQKEFQRRSSFAYTVMNLEESKCLGAIYIYPSSNPNYETMILLWVRTSAVKDGLDTMLFDSVKKWISKDWPFQKVAYPGREINWIEWESMN